MRLSVIAGSIFRLKAEATGPQVKPVSQACR
jgi:hypothetical protein